MGYIIVLNIMDWVLKYLEQRNKNQSNKKNGKIPSFIICLAIKYHIKTTTYFVRNLKNFLFTKHAIHP